MDGEWSVRGAVKRGEGVSARHFDVSPLPVLKELTKNEGRISGENWQKSLKSRSVTEPSPIYPILNSISRLSAYLLKSISCYPYEQIGFPWNDQADVLELANDMTAGGQTTRWAHVAFLNGELAAIAGIARSRNPHPAGSAEARNWSSGWRSHRPPALVRQSDTSPTESSAESAPTQATQPDEGQTTMDLLEKLPGMTDADLGTLLSNAERLAQTGTTKQQRAAEAALPAIRAESVRRSELKPAPVKRAPRASRKAAAAAAPAA